MRETMRALVKEGCRVETRIVTKPPSPKPSNVMVRVTLAGLCRTDIFVAEGKISTRDPLILGHEFAGVVDSIGSDVELLKAGERVTINPLLPCYACQFCHRDDHAMCQESSFLGIDHDGCFAGFVSVPQTAVFTIPAQVSDLAAAYAEPIAASLAVLKTGIRPLDSGLIYGSNRFSELLLKILAIHGFANVQVHDDRSDSKLPDSAYDFIVETAISTEALQVMTRALKPGGTIILKSRIQEPVMLRLNELIKKEPVLRIVNYGSFDQAIDLLSSGQLDVESLLDDIYSLDQFSQVLHRSKQTEARKPFFAPWNN